MNAPAWAVWLAVGLGIANVAVWACVVVGARGLIAQYKQTYGPMLSMLFAAAPSASTRLDVELYEETWSVPTEHLESCAIHAGRDCDCAMRYVAELP